MLHLISNIHSKEVTRIEFLISLVTACKGSVYGLLSSVPPYYPALTGLVLPSVPAHLQSDSVFILVLIKVIMILKGRLVEVGFKIYKERVNYLLLLLLPFSQLNSSY